MPRTFSSSYLAGDAAARAFFPSDFRDPSARAARAREAARRRVAPAVASVLAEQQARLPASAARQRNLESLLGGDTAIVVSGQQVGLFLGPLYTFYKAASTISVARAIQAESGVRCVPLFWLQTEDHDFAEIAACAVASERDGGLARLALNDETADEARRSIAHRVLGPEVAALVEALDEHLGEGPAAREVAALMRAHYVPGRSLAGAFAGALAEIFADEGLLILDPRDPRISRAAGPVLERAIEDAPAIERQLDQQAEALRSHGFAEQIPLRAGAPLLFFHRGGPEGPRFRPQRLRDEGDVRYALGSANERASARDLLERIRREPLGCSTSALLRPLVQDFLLPTVGYVGGPAEVSYFAQLAPLYAHFALSMPLVIPRARFRCVDARARRLLQALGLGPDDLARPPAELLARVAATAATGAPDPAALSAQVRDELAPRVAQIADAVVSARPELARAAERTRRSVAHALARLTNRYARALVERDEVVSQRLKRLQDLLQPQGAPQERIYGWPSLAARVGAATFKRLVFESLAEHGPFPTELLELRP